MFANVRNAGFCRNTICVADHLMEKNMTSRLLILAASTGLLIASTAGAQTFDSQAAEALAKKSKCFTCHSIDKKKDGPSFKETAAKYKGKSDGEAKLFTHLTTSPKVKVDGKEETHESPKTKSEAEIKNLAAWILSR
jgi:cytochrome c